MKVSTIVSVSIGALFTAFVTGFSVSAPAIITGGMIILCALIISAIEDYINTKPVESPFNEYKLTQLDTDLTELKQAVADLHEQVSQVTGSVSNLQIASGFRNLKKD